jgi:hypothetical protein
MSDERSGRPLLTRREMVIETNLRMSRRELANPRNELNPETSCAVGVGLSSRRRLRGSTGRLATPSGQDLADITPGPAT